MMLQPGETIHNRYRIERIIAQGGMGAVYLARDMSLDIPVAVKENLGGTQSYARQFRREGTVLAGLAHPSLPRVTDHFASESGSQYLVMDYIAGEDLREMIKRLGPLPEDLVLRVGITICDALTYLHTRQPPILHRDIKPGNIKISPEGEIFLVDFGLVKIVQGSGATTTGAQSLTPGYAPPEQYGGGTDQRSDIYSLGATLYASLTGKIPEDGISRAMGNSRLTQVLTHRPKTDSRLASVIEKALSVEPEKRFSSADQFREALFALLPASEKTKDLSSLAPTISQEKAKPPQRVQLSNKSPWGVVGIAVVVIIFIALVAGAESMVRTLLPASHPAPTITLIGKSTVPAAITPTSTITLSPNHPTLTASVILPPPIIPTKEIVSNSKTHGSIAFASDRDGIPQVYLLHLSDGFIQKITNLAQGACQPDWSPSGDQLVIVSPCSGDTTPHKKSSLFLINTDGSGLTGIKTMPGGDFDPDWSPDGNQIAFTSLRDSTDKTLKTFIYVYDLASGKAARLLKTNANQQNPQYSPDGSKIAFEYFLTNNPQIYMMKSDGSDPSLITTEAEGAARYPSWFLDGTKLTFNRSSQTMPIWSKPIDDPRTKSLPVDGIAQPGKNASFSPDGNWILFVLNGDIWYVPVAGGEPVNLTQSDSKDFDPDWKP